MHKHVILFALKHVFICKFEDITSFFSLDLTLLVIQSSAFRVSMSDENFCQDGAQMLKTYVILCVFFKWMD